MDIGLGWMYTARLRVMSFVSLFFILNTSPLLALELDSYEPTDNTRAGATQLTAGDDQDHSYFPSGDIDWYKFFLDENSCVFITGSSVFSTNLRVFNSELEEVARSQGAPWNSDSGPDCDSIVLPSRENAGFLSDHLSLDSLPRGQYYLRIGNGFAGGAFNTETNYKTTLRTGPSPYREDGFEDNDEQGTAKNIGIGETQKHNFYPTNDVDWLRVVIPQTGIMTLTINNPFKSELVHIYGNDGQKYSFGVGARCPDFICSGPYKPNKVVSDLLFPGVYFVKIEQVDNYDGGIAEEYSVRVSFRETPIADNSDTYEPDNWITSATVVTNSEVQEHYLGTRNDRDWYVFRINQCLNIVPEVYARLDTLAQIRLLDSQLNLLETSVRQRVGDPEIEYNHIEKELRRGVYYLSVERDLSNPIQTAKSLYLFRLLAFSCEPNIIAPIIDLLLNE